VADVTDPHYVEHEPIDENDPLYDAAEDSIHSQQHRYRSQHEGRTNVATIRASKAVYGPLLTKSEFKLQLMECLQRNTLTRVDSGRSDFAPGRAGCQEYHAEIVKRAISLAMDRVHANAS
jgi:hypothetical protein